MYRLATTHSVTDRRTDRQTDGQHYHVNSWSFILRPVWSANKVTIK